MFDHLSVKIAATEREGNNSLLRLNVECTPSPTGTTPLPRSGHGTYLNWLRNVLLERGEINGISPHPAVDCDPPGGRLPPILAYKRSEGLGSRFGPLPEVSYQSWNRRAPPVRTMGRRSHEIQFVGVGPRLCGDRVGLSKRRMGGEGKELYQKPVGISFPCKLFTKTS